MKIKKRYSAVLTIAGSDSSGGAGIQADIKSISANGGYAATVITASTAQNTQGVTDIYPLPVSHIAAQLEAVLCDIKFGAVKIGMLYSSEIIDIVERKLEEYKVSNIILDPVMLSTSGRKLLSDDAIERLSSFIPKVLLLTPNIPEAEILLGRSVSKDNLEASAIEIAQKYNVSVLLKGGHLEDSKELIDTLCIKDSFDSFTIKNRVIDSINTHGTGCSLSSSIATYISLGFDLKDATKKANLYLHRAIEEGRDIFLGDGNGPIKHFF